MPLWMPRHGRARNRARTNAATAESVDASCLGEGVVSIDALPDTVLARIFALVDCARTGMQLRAHRDATARAPGCNYAVCAADGLV